MTYLAAFCIALAGLAVGIFWGWAAREEHERRLRAKAWTTLMLRLDSAAIWQHIVAAEKFTPMPSPRCDPRKGN